MENLKFLSDITDLLLNFDSSKSVLNELTRSLAKYLSSEVCSIYIYDENKETLVLKATYGLNQASVGNVSMPPEEGLTGITFSSGNYQFITNASTHPRFKYFPGIGEEPFNTFIGIPLKKHDETFGVLVFQFIDNPENSNVLKMLLETIGNMISSFLKNHIMLNSNITRPRNYDEEMVLQGIPISEGISIGKPVHMVYHFLDDDSRVKDVKREEERLKYSFDKTKNEVMALINNIDSGNLRIDKEIFHTHLMILSDGSFRDDIFHHVLNLGRSAAYSIRHVSDKFIERFRKIDDPYLKERAADIEDVCNRLLKNLGVIERHISLEKESIIVSNQLGPGDTASLDLSKVKGIVTENDGQTSHMALVAKGMGIPAVSGIEHIIDITEYAKDLIIDGYEGKIIINPSDANRDKYLSMQSQLQVSGVTIEQLPREIVCHMGRKVYLGANVASILDADKAQDLGAFDIGLVRTEIFYLAEGEENFNVEVQKKIYQSILSKYTNGPVTFRLLDIGADKMEKYSAKEPNPAMGLRGARFLIKNESLLETQLEALLDLNDSRVKLLVPFVAKPEEFYKIKDIIRKKAERMGVNMPPVGVMIEIPSIAFALERLDEEVDFYSIGTNDLFQYFFAADRNNIQIFSNYKILSECFMNFMEFIYNKLSQTGKDVEICGEIAHEEEILYRLIEMGYSKFSLNPYLMSKASELITERCKREN